MEHIKVIVKGKARSRIALGVVAAYLRLHPNTTLKRLKEVFPDSICPKAPVQFRSMVPLGVFQPLDVVQSLPEQGLTIAHYTANNEILNTSDGVAVAVTKSWTQEAFDALVIAASMHGIAVLMVDENTKWATGVYELDFSETHHQKIAATPQPDEESQPEVFDEYLHQSAKKHKESNSKKWFGSLSVAALLMFIITTTMLHRGGCSSIFSRTVVDTIIIMANQGAQPIVVRQDTVAQVRPAEQEAAVENKAATTSTEVQATGHAQDTCKPSMRKSCTASKKGAKVEKAEGVEKVKSAEKAKKNKPTQPAPKKEKKRYSQQPLI